MSATVTDDEMLGYVRRYVQQNDLVDAGTAAAIGLDSSLAGLGLDSIGVAELLLGARAELVAAGRISPDATLLELPALDTVGDLGRLLRTLEALTSPAGSLVGRVALVTGGNRGLGAACVRELAARGASVAVLARDVDAAAVLVKELPGGHLALPGDVTRQQSLDDAVGEVVARHGKLHVVIANAGIQKHGSVTELSGDDFEQVVTTNLVGGYRTARATQDALAAGRGYLLFVSSVAAFTASSGMSAYASSKAGLEMLAHTLWLDLAPRGIDVGSVVPTWITTDMLAEAEEEIEALKDLRSMTSGLLGHLTDGIPGGPLGGSVSAQECARIMVDGAEARQRRIWIPPILEEVWRLGPLLTSPVAEHITRRLLES